METEPVFVEHLRELEACEEAIDWAKTQPDARTAWMACGRADWLLWVSARTADAKLVVLAACQCARWAQTFWNIPNDDRPMKAIHAAEAWVREEATIRDTQSAVSAAYAAAREADTDDAKSAEAAALAAAEAANAASFVLDAAVTACDAAYAADLAVVADPAAVASHAVTASYAAANAVAIDTPAYRCVWLDAQAEMADLVRAVIPFEALS